MPITNLLEPKNDYVFKMIFGYVGNEEITKDLLNSIIEDIHIQSLELDCKEILEKDLKADKYGVLDIRAIVDDNTQVDIEMQIIDRKDIESRILFYWSMLYSKSINEGDDYSQTKRTIIILFTDYEIEQFKEIKKYFSKWHICEDEYKNVILTNKFELYIIELPKHNKYATSDDKLSAWTKFIKNPGEMNMSEINDNEALKKAKNVLQEISNDEYEQELAFRRKLAMMDKKAIEARAIEKGLEKGMAQGISQGKTEEQIRIVQELLKEDIDINVISKVTGLTIEQIEKLK